MDFQEACTQGHVSVIRKDLTDFPTWANGRSPQGETCLHMASVMGQVDVIKTLLEFGADPNIRTTFERGHRQHPLSWLVLGGHVEAARLLMDNGADVNADIDWPSRGVESKATVLDVLMDIMPKQPNIQIPEIKKYYEMKELLLEYGAKTYSDLESLAEL